MGKLVVGKARSFWGEFAPPSDKSITHRAYMLSSICERGGVVENPLRAEDCDDTLQALRDLGADASVFRDRVLFKPSSLTNPSKQIWCGNSGTTMRLLCGLLCGSGVSCELAGDESLSKRPMARVVNPLNQMGADVAGEYPPLRIAPAKLKGIAYSSPIASAQVKSALLLAGLFADGETSVVEPAKSRDHTERMLKACGCSVSVAGLMVRVRSGMPKKLEMRVPGDISSAAFFLIGGAMIGGPVTAVGVGLNPTRVGVLNVLAQAGAKMQIVQRGDQSGEPTGDVRTEKPAHLKPFSISGSQVPAVIDEIPILSVLATQCEGTTTIRGAQELRVKESDRIEAVASGLRAMGAEVEVFEDGMSISGPVALKAAVIDAKRDHRLAMAFAMAGLIAEGETVIEGAETISTSFPNFEMELRRLSGD